MEGATDPLALASLRHWIYNSVSQPFGLQVPVEDNFLSQCTGKPRIIQIVLQIVMYVFFIQSTIEIKPDIKVFISWLK
jgi:hypothetical protein